METPFYFYLLATGDCFRVKTAAMISKTNVPNANAGESKNIPVPIIPKI